MFKPPLEWRPHERTHIVGLSLEPTPGPASTYYATDDRGRGWTVSVGLWRKCCHWYGGYKGESLAKHSGDTTTLSEAMSACLIWSER